MMRGIVSTLAVSAAALLLALPGRAVDAPTPDLSFSFTDSIEATIGSIEWQWNKDPAVYVYSPRTESNGNPSKAVTISDACHPGRAYTWPTEFSVMSYIKVTDAPDKGTVASFGNNCFLLKQNATTMRFGTADTYVDATAENLSTGWHLVVAKCTSSGLSIQIDGGTAVTGSTAVTANNGFQIGTRWEGPLNNTALQATNLYIDELAIYNSVLTDEQVAALVEAYPAILPQTYTADLSTSAEATVNYSALPWDVGSAPGTDAKVIIKTPAAGITITMDQATRVFDLLTVQGSGKLTLAADSGVTGTALSTNELVVETEVDLSAITSSLGTVTVAANKTLTTGENTTLTNLTFGSATAKVKVAGSTGLSAIPYGMQSKTGTVEIVPQVTVTDATWSFNTAQTFTYSANVNAPRLVVGDSGSANATITQLGGTISLTSTATACDNTGASAILLGHWNTTTTYNLQGGTISAPDGALCLGWDGTTTLNVGSTDGTAVALVETYGVSGGPRTNTANLTLLPNGTLKVGEGGIVLGSHSAKTMTLAGGTLSATATATAALTNGLHVSAASNIGAATGTTLTIDKVVFDQAVALTVGSATEAGTVYMQAVSGEAGSINLAAGTLILPAGQEGAVTLADGTSLKLVLSNKELALGYTLQVGSADLSKVTLQKVDSDGQLTGITDADGTLSNGVFTSAMTTWTPKATEAEGSYSWSNTNNWSKGLPTGSAPAVIKVSEATTIALPADATCSALYVNGPATLTLSGSAPTGLGALTVLGDASVPVALANTVSSIAVEADYTLTLDAGAEGATLTKAIAVAGTVKKVGSGTLTLGADLAPTGGTIVAEGTLAFGAGVIPSTSGAYSSAGDVTVEGGATLDVAGVGDSFLRVVTLKAGATYANASSTAALGTGQRQLGGIVLEGDATVAATRDFGILKGGFAAAELALNGHTLTKTGAGNFWLCNTTVSGGGTLKVEEGSIKSVQSNCTINDDIVFDCGSSSTAFDFAGQQVTVNGAVTKRGTGTMTCAAILAGTDKVLTVEEGTLVLTKANTRVDAASTGGSDLVTTVIKAGATLDVSADGATLYAASTFGGNQNSVSVLVQGKLITRDWYYGQALGALRVNTPTVALDGGTVEFTTNIANTGNDRRAFTVTANGGTLVARDGVSVTLDPPNGIANSGTLNLTGEGAFSIASPAIPGSVAVSSTIGGTGTVSGTLTFNSGAALDVTAGTLTAGTVAVADGVTVAVTLPEDAEADDIVLTCSSPADVAAKLTGAPEGLKFAANEAGTAVVLVAKPTIVIPPVAEVELSEASQALLLAKAQTAGLSEVTAVTGKTTVNGAETTLTAAQIDNALAVFGDSIVTADGTNKTLKVDYNFGIVSITPQYSATGELQTFLVKVAVETADGALASIAEGVSVKLVDSEGVIIEDGYGFGFQDPDGDGMYEAYFSADPAATYPLVGRSFKVKATK